MGDTTFRGDVRATDGFKHLVIDSTTGAETETEIVDGEGVITAEGGITASGVVKLGGNTGEMTAGAGITAGTGTVYSASIVKMGSIIVTRIYVDLTGLHGGGTAGDIIGVDAGAVSCNFGLINTLINGVILSCTIHCGETPAGGDPDIDLYVATEANGAQDAAIGDLTETLIMNNGDLAIGNRVTVSTAMPANNTYIYLTNGTATDATYTAGKLVIELIGYLA